MTLPRTFALVASTPDFLEHLREGMCQTLANAFANEPTTETLNDCRSLCAVVAEIDAEIAKAKETVND